MRGAMLALALGAVAVMAGCGGGEESSSGAETASENPYWSPPPDQLPFIGRKAPGPYVLPKGEPPEELVIREIKEGSGPAAELGDVITVRYVGVTYKGHAYSNAWENPQPDHIKLGSPDVERGFGTGVEGMKVGGRRELLVPPPLLFYPGEKPIPLGPGDSVAYIVDVFKIKKPDSSPSAS